METVSQNDIPPVTEASGVTMGLRVWQNAKIPGLVGAHWGPQLRNLKGYKSIFLQNIIILKCYL